MTEKKYKHTPCVLCIIEDPATHQLLMVKNLRGMNKGFCNFPGGKMDYGESIKTALYREIKEETGLKLKRAKYIGRIDIIPDDELKIKRHQKDVQVYVFYSNDYSGDIQAKPGEVELMWVNKSEIPYDKMRDNDKLWVPEVMQGKVVHMAFFRNTQGELVEAKKYHLFKKAAIGLRFPQYKIIEKCKKAPQI